MERESAAVTVRNQRSRNEPTIQQASENVAPGRLKVQFVRTGTDTWYSVARKQMLSTRTAGQ